MPNIEIKARCNNLKKALDIVHEIKTDYVGSLQQVDTYYETKEGRLKLREIWGGNPHYFFSGAGSPPLGSSLQKRRQFKLSTYAEEN